MMDTYKREIELLERYSARQAAVLVRLAMGATITETARGLGMSRTTIYQLMKAPEFRLALLEEMRQAAVKDHIAQKQHAYQQKILKAVIRTFSKNKHPHLALKQFRSYLERIDQTTGMNTP